MARFNLAAAAALFLLWVIPANAGPVSRDRGSTVPVTAEPIASFDRADPARKRFGDLEFRGGLVLSSPHRDFGGVSALRVQADGSRFIAVTDKGNWLTGRIVYDRDRPAALADVLLAPILGADGRPLARRGWFDTESIAQDGGGAIFIGIERANRIVRFDFARDGVRARGRPIVTPPGIGELPNNRGLECLTFAPRGHPLAGTLIAISERGLDARGNIRGFFIGGPAPGEFSLLRRDDFDVTDCAVLPNGDLLVLERHFTMSTGVSSRLRRIAITTMRPGETVDGSYILKADMGQQIDNLEALSVHRARDGSLVITLVSDDNFSVLQRTLLLQFKLVE